MVQVTHFATVEADWLIVMCVPHTQLYSFGGWWTPMYLYMQLVPGIDASVLQRKDSGSQVIALLACKSAEGLQVLFA